MQRRLKALGQGTTCGMLLELRDRGDGGAAALLDRSRAEQAASPDPVAPMLLASPPSPGVACPRPPVLLAPALVGTGCQHGLRVACAASGLQLAAPDCPCCWFHGNQKYTLVKIFMIKPINI